MPASGFPERPRVLLNCAASLDGRIAYAGGRPAPLSGPEDLRRVHRMRAESDAILVGVGTVVADDPSLRVRWDLIGQAPGELPRRVVLDSRGRTPESARVLDGSARTLIATADGVARQWPATVRVAAFGPRRVELPRLLAYLATDGVGTLLVEGGAQVLASFVRSGLFDQFTIYFAPVAIGGDSAPRILDGTDLPADRPFAVLRRTEVAACGEGTLVTYVPK